MSFAIQITLLLVFCCFWFKKKFKERHAGFATLPTPKKHFLLHNTVDFLKSSMPRILLRFKKWHDELGNVYLLTFHPFDSGIVVVADHEIAEKISFHQPNRFKADTYRPLSRWVGSNGYLMSAESQWRILMKPVLTVYHPKNIDRSIDIINRHANDCVGVLRKSENFPYDLLTFFRQTTLDISFETLLDFQLHAKHGSHLDYVEALNKFAKLGMISHLDPVCRNDFLYRFTRTYRKEKKVLKIIHDLTLKIVKQRRAEMKAGHETNKLVMLNHYLTTPVGGRFLSDDEIRAELDSSIMGTHESTKATLTFLFYHLAKHPEIQEKVLEEAKMLLTHDPERHLDEIELKQVPYTESVIKETLRLFPPIPFIGRKLESGITIGKFSFPQNVEVFISPFLMGRNSEYFESPESFIADRFVDLKKPPIGFNPFSIGMRQCSGRKLAMVSLKVITLKIIYNFKVSLPPKSKELIVTWQQILEPKDKIHLVLESR